MKYFRKLILTALTAFIILPMAAYGGGAEVIRDKFEYGGFEWDGDQTLAVFATDMYFWCGDEEYTVPYDWMGVFRPDGTIKTHDRGNLFTRVFYPATPEDFWGPDFNPCPFINGGPLVAEGISHFTSNDNDATVGHPNRRNVWGYTVTGTLYDVAGHCDIGMTDLLVIRRFQIMNRCEEDCFIPRVIKGPVLSCAE